MGTYIHFTNEQKERANSVDLEEFLRRRGEKLLRSGREFRLERRHRITVRGSEWYDHAARQGGYAVSFVQHYYGMSYQAYLHNYNLHSRNQTIRNLHHHDVGARGVGLQHRAHAFEDGRHAGPA